MYSRADAKTRTLEMRSGAAPKIQNQSNAGAPVQIFSRAALFTTFVKGAGFSGQN